MRLMVALTVLCVSVLTASQATAARCAKETESDVTRQYPLSSFSKLSVSGLFHLELVKGDRNQLEVLTKPSVIDAFKFRTKRDRLTIGPGSCKDDLISYRLTFRDLKEMDLQGEITLDSLEPLTMKDLEIDVSGNVRGELALKTQKLDIATTGDVLLELQGTTEHFQLAVLGNGSVDAARLQSRTADLNIWGNGIETLHVLEFMRVSARGNTLIQYYGNPTTDFRTKSNAYIRQLED